MDQSAERRSRTGRKKALWFLLFSTLLAFSASLVAPATVADVSEVPEMMADPAALVPLALDLTILPGLPVSAGENPGTRPRNFLPDLQDYQTDLITLIKLQFRRYRSFQPTPLDRLLSLYTSLPDPLVHT